MKPNDPYIWKITLCPATESSGPTHRPKMFEFTGDIEGALNAANEMESEVDFEVQQFVITRGLKANTPNP